MNENPRKLLRLPVVLERVGYGRSTLYKLKAQGKFPEPIRLGERAVAWLESDIEDWIEARIASGSTEVSE